jgi:hypothetical protein
LPHRSSETAETMSRAHIAGLALVLVAAATADSADYYLAIAVPHHSNKPAPATENAAEQDSVRSLSLALSGHDWALADEVARTCPDPSGLKLTQASAELLTAARLYSEGRVREAQQTAVRLKSTTGASDAADFLLFLNARRRSMFLPPAIAFAASTYLVLLVFSISAGLAQSRQRDGAL